MPLPHMDAKECTPGHSGKVRHDGEGHRAVAVARGSVYHRSGNLAVCPVAERAYRFEHRRHFLLRDRNGLSAVFHFDGHLHGGTGIPAVSRKAQV